MPSCNWIDCNGELLLDSESIVKAMHPGFYFGLSVYETVFVKDFRVAFFEEHLARLEISMNYFQIKPDSSFQTKIKDRIKRIIEKNSCKDGRIRVIVSLDENKNFFSVISSSLIQKFPDSISLYISSHRKPYPPVYPTNVKISANIFSYLSSKEAIQNGLEEGLMLDTMEHITEGSYCNIFLKKENIFYTPSTDVSILEGVTRSKILQIAKSLGIKIIEQKIPTKFLDSIDRIYISSSSRGLLFVSKLNSRIFPQIEDKEYLQIKMAYNTMQEESFLQW